MIPSQVIAAAQTAAAIYASLLISVSDPTTHQLADETLLPSPSPPQPTITRRLNSCNPQSNCVSSNYREPPNRYVSPFKLVNDPDVAFQRAVRDLKNTNANNANANNDMMSIAIVEIVPKEHYVHLTVPGTAPSSLDDLELVFSETIVNVKCEARVTLPPSPFCIKKNCINGNMDQRTRVEKVGYLLGLPANDREEMQEGAKWTPIFFNSDRVPGFDDDIGY